MPPSTPLAYWTAPDPGRFASWAHANTLVSGQYILFVTSQCTVDDCEHPEERIYFARPFLPLTTVGSAADGKASVTWILGPDGDSGNSNVRVTSQSVCRSQPVVA